MMSDVMTLIPRDEYKQLKEENQRLRGLLARCDDWLRETLQKTGGNPRHARLIDDIEKELGDGTIHD